MKPTDLHLFRSYGRPAVGAAGEVIAALSTPDLDSDTYRGVLHLLRPDADPVEFTHGPRDSAPVLSPDGRTVVFLRAGESGPAQLYAMPRHGGEPRRLADHPLGASAVTFSPDGRTIAYLAAVPEPGRYGTPERDGAPERDGGDPDGAAGPPRAGAERSATADAEPPRRITALAYRSDGKGFVLDKPEQVFALEMADADGAPPAEARPRQLTDETGPVGRPAFTPDGREVIYVRPVAQDSLRGEIAAVPVDGVEPAQGRRVAATAGDATHPIVHGDTVYYVGSAFAGNDFAGQTLGLWAVPLAGGAPRRMTDERTVHVDPMAGEPAVAGQAVLVAVADRGAVALRATPMGGEGLSLSGMPVLIGGQRVVKAFSVTGTTVAAVVAGPSSTGDVLTIDLDASGAGSVAGPELVLTDVCAPLRAAGVAPVIELTGAAADGYPVHGWLVLPPEQFAGPHPVLLSVHGGPYSAYTWGVFDEAQMYAGSGYAVVLPNPRGSSGYGLDHGRAIVRKLGTVGVDDVLALLDVALRRDDLDADRVGVMGGSFGGFMTSWLASHAPERFVAGISERAVNAWDSFAGASDIGFFFAGGYVGTGRDEQWSASPLAYADRIGIPLLIIHSEQDWRCPLEQAQRLFVALKTRGHDAEMLIFPGEGHELSRSGRPRHRRERFEAILDWWNRYLPVG